MEGAAARCLPIERAGATACPLATHRSHLSPLSPPPPQGIFVHLNHGGVSFKQPDDMLARELVSAINHHAAKRRALQEASDADSVALLVGTPP